MHPLQLLFLLLLYRPQESLDVGILLLPIGGGLGFFLGSRVRTEAAIARVERINRVNAVFLVMTGWLLVALGVVALVVGGWSVKIALITLAFLIAALLVTFHKRTREGPDLERFRNSSRKEDQA